MIKLKETTRQVECVKLTKEELIELLARRTVSQYAQLVINHVATLKLDHSKAMHKLRLELAKIRWENNQLRAE